MFNYMFKLWLLKNVFWFRVWNLDIEYGEIIFFVSCVIILYKLYSWKKLDFILYYNDVIIVGVIVIYDWWICLFRWSYIYMYVILE